jgi:acetyl esterase/lipase
VIYLKGFPDIDDPALPAYMQANGFTGLSVDFRGQRSSDGQYTIEGTAEDASAVVDFLRSDAARRTYRVDPARIILVGGSAGSFAALKTTALDTHLRCVAVIVPFNWAVFGLAARSDSSLRQLAAGVMGRISGGARPVIRAAPDFAVSMVAAAEAYDLRSPAAALEGRSVFLVGAEQDATAPLPAHFVPLVQAARGARGTQVRDTVVADTHNLPATYEAVFAALVRWLRADCLGTQ